MRRASMTFVLAAAVLVAVPGSAGASTYTNPNPIAILDNAKANPYPSSITVEGVDGTVTRVRATLNSLFHTFPDDISVLLVSPNGAATVLMGDVCSNDVPNPAEDATGQSFTFDDAASASLPNEEFCPGGTYKPTIDFGQQFDPPAPPGVQTTVSMAALNGGPANGGWQLFVRDFSPPDTGVLVGGWTLDLLTDATCSGKQATLTGTAGDDELVGTEGDDVILGFGGKDTIRGLGGKDTICGGQRKDILRGGSGKDKLLGQGGKDKLSGGGGKDQCIGGKKDDTAKKCEVEKSI